MRRVTQRILHLLFPQSPQTQWLEVCTPADLSLHCTPAGPLHDTSVQSLFSYRDDLVRQLIREIKYRKNPFVLHTVSFLLADLVVGVLEEDLLVENTRFPVIVTDIPMPRKRRRERGWNQSELLATHVARGLGEDWATYRQTLFRKRDTSPQVNLTRHKRLENMNGVFAPLSTNQLAGKTVIIIDDVTTTGATIAEAKQTLENAGASRVLGFTVAH